MPMSLNQFLHALRDTLDDWHETEENGDWEDAVATIQAIEDLVERFGDDPHTV